jgi:hypothetical protein
MLELRLVQTIYYTVVQQLLITAPNAGYYDFGFRLNQKVLAESVFGTPVEQRAQNNHSS